MQTPRFIRTLTGRRLDWTLAAVAFVVSMLPVSALLPWTDDLARLLSVPLAPVTHFGIFLREQVRPPQAAFDPSAPETVQLEREVAQYRMLYEQSRLEVERLERSLASMRAVSARVDAPETRLIEASVIASDPSRRTGVLALNAGERHGVRAGAAALVDGDVFAGVIAPNVGSFSSSLIPASKLPSIGARIFPPEGSDPQKPASSYPGAVLKPTGRGTWTAEVATSLELAPGMVARLADDRYGRAALGSRIGVVVSVEPVEQAPLARRVEIRPVIDLDGLSSVVLAVPAEVPR
jgi:hypothetical protein